MGFGRVVSGHNENLLPIRSRKIDIRKKQALSGIDFIRKISHHLIYSIFDQQISNHLINIYYA